MRTERQTETYWDLSAKRYGIVGRADLDRCNLSTSAIWRRVQSGELEELRPGAFRVRGTPRSWRQDLMAVQVWAGPPSRISHRSAAQLHAFDGFTENLLEITTQRRLRAPDVIVHQATNFQTYDRMLLGPLVVTTPARTLLDLGAVVGIDEVEDALEDALRRKLTTLKALHWELKTEGGQGHKGSRILLELLNVRPLDYVPKASRLEIRIDRVLRVTPLPPYTGQFKLVTRVGERWIDFAFPEFTVAVEGDGYNNHGGRKSWLYDNQRLRAIEALGWDVIRVTWDDITNRPDEFIQDLYAKLIRKGWTPPPEALILSTVIG